MFVCVCVCWLIYDFKGFEQFGIDVEGQLPAVWAGGDVYGAQVCLVSAVLHVHETDVLPFEEFGVAMGMAGCRHCLFKEVLVLSGAREHSTVAAVLVQHCVLLHDGLEVDA